MVTLIIASLTSHKQFLIFANLYANMNNMYGGIPANWSIVDSIAVSLFVNRETAMLSNE